MNRDWDNKEREKGREPSQRFYDFIFGIGLGFIGGLTMMGLWLLG